MSDAPWTYQCSVGAVIDGDTLEVAIDLGFRVTRVERVRLLGVDTPELRGGTDETKAAAVQARNYVLDWVDTHEDNLDYPLWPFLLVSRKGDGFGRWLGTILCRDCGTSLADELITAGFGDPA